MIMEENKQFMKETQKELLQIVTNCNNQLNGVTYVDTDYEHIRELRNSIIKSIDLISHLEYKDLL